MEFTRRSLDFVKIGDRVNLDWDKYWSFRGHNILEGMISPDRQYFYLNIPKNSSSSIKPELESLGWDYSHYSDYRDFETMKVIVALRDPVDRWLSGMAEYLMMYQQRTIDNIVDPNVYDFQPLLGEKLALSLLFDRLTFDDHTERQAVFLRTIPFAKCQWLWIDQDFNQNFSSFLTAAGYTNNFINAKRENSTDDPSFDKKKKLKDFLRYVIEHDQHKKSTLEEYLWADYELINQAKFYGK